MLILFTGLLNCIWKCVQGYIWVWVSWQFTRFLQWKSAFFVCIYKLMIPQVITAVEFVTSNSPTFSFARRFTLSTKTDRNASCHATRMHVAWRSCHATRMHVAWRSCHATRMQLSCNSHACCLKILVAWRFSLVVAWRFYRRSLQMLH